MIVIHKVTKHKNGDRTIVDFFDGAHEGTGRKVTQQDWHDAVVPAFHTHGVVKIFTHQDIEVWGECRE